MDRNRYAYFPGRALLMKLRNLLSSRGSTSIGPIPGREVIRSIDELMGFLDDEANEVWTPFEPAHLPDSSGDREYVEQLARTTGVSVRAVIGFIKENAEKIVRRNNLYQVVIDPIPEDLERHRPRLIHLSIKRLDQKPIRDWRHLQRIKNELVGERHEAVELFPVESRLIDTANQYHLWVFGEPGTRWGFGFEERLVLPPEHVSGAVQRTPEPSDWRRVLVTGDIALWQPMENQWRVYRARGGSDPKPGDKSLYVMPASWTHEMMNHGNALYYLGVRSVEDETREAVKDGV